MRTGSAMIGAAALLLTACVPVVVPGQVRIDVPVPGVVIDPVDPYYYSSAYCVGCWYGEWGGRIGYHPGGGRPWGRRHVEPHHHARHPRPRLLHERRPSDRSTKKSNPPHPTRHAHPQNPT